MARKCRARELRHKIIIQAENPQTDGGGGEGDPWAAPTTVATARARIEPLKGSEQLRAMQLEDKISHLITIRYRAGIIPKMRIKFGTRLFNIRFVRNPEERNRFLELTCEEGVAT